MRCLDIRWYKSIDFFTTIGTSLRESFTSFEPICVKICWEYNLTAMLEKSQKVARLPSRNEVLPQDVNTMPVNLWCRPRRTCWNYYLAWVCDSVIVDISISLTAHSEKHGLAFVSYRILQITLAYIIRCLHGITLYMPIMNPVMICSIQITYQSISVFGRNFGSRHSIIDNANKHSNTKRPHNPDPRHVSLFLTQETSPG